MLLMRLFFTQNVWALGKMSTENKLQNIFLALAESSFYAKRYIFVKIFDIFKGLTIIASLFFKCPVKMLECKKVMCQEINVI